MATSYGYVALILFFTMSFSIYTASEFINTEDNLNQSISEYQERTGKQSQDVEYQNILTQLIKPEILATTAIFALTTGILSGSLTIAIAAGAIAYMAMFFIAPFDVIRAAGLIYPYDWLVFGFMNILLMVALFSFIRGRDL